MEAMFGDRNRKRGEFLRLSHFAQALGASSKEDLQSCFVEVMRRAQARYAPPQSFDLPEREKPIAAAYADVLGCLPHKSEADWLMQPAIELKNSSTEKQIALVCEACTRLRSFTAQDERNVSFVAAALRRNVKLQPEEEALWRTCQGQWRRFKAGQPAYLADADASLLNDICNFREEFVRSWRSAPVPMGASGFEWRWVERNSNGIDGDWLPFRQEGQGRFTKSNAFSQSSKWATIALAPDRLSRNVVRRSDDIFIIERLQKHAKRRETLRAEGVNTKESPELRELRQEILGEFRARFALPEEIA